MLMDKTFLYTLNWTLGNLFTSQLPTTNTEHSRVLGKYQLFSLTRPNTSH